jgi:hypothetical protein
MEAQGMKEGEDFLKSEWILRFFCGTEYIWMDLVRVFKFG